MTDFVLQVVTALDKNNASEIIKEPKACENLISQLIDKLQPAELKMRIKNEQNYWTSQQRSNLSHFEERASSLAVDTHNGQVARAMCHTESSKSPNNKRKREELKNEGSVENKDKEVESQNVNDDWDNKCLNPACPEYHRLRDCPNTSDQLKRQLLRNYYREAKKRRRRSQVKNLVIIDFQFSDFIFL